ncbi:MAG: adenylyl-sulfate kinase [Candidatus Heimdallarchaeota archaeon]|nr:adenylyl-sulfate kinase [Candidatus Heimdallarchaeota archaeon]MBY8993042.1 adenylyl-sulfate kinase [Candidatus Heimdallarchaeota archaeon]
MNKPGFVVWFTGLSGSGKTTLAVELEKELLRRNLRVQRLDGDIVRKSLTRDLGFSEEDRKKNIERITFVTRLLAKHGVATLVSFISPYISVRDNARNEVNEENAEFVEVFVKASVEECARRDVKGLYEKAFAGEIENFTGVSHPYEEPPNSEIVCNTEYESVEESTQIVLDYLEKESIIPKAKEIIPKIEKVGPKV